MPRKFLDNIRTEISTLFADNTTGDISAADLQQVTLDMVDSLAQDEGFIYGDVATAPIALTATPIPISTGYTQTIGGAPGFVILNQAGGSIQLGPTAGFSYQIKSQITLATTNNEEIHFQLAVNGSPVGYIGSISGATGGDQVSVAVEFIRLTSLSNEVWQIYASTPDGTGTITVESIFLYAAVLPTNNP